MPSSKTSSRKKGREKKEEPPLRGPDGRFVKTTYVVIDEFGSASPYSRKEKTFGYAASVTEDKAGMERLAKENRKLHNTSEEVKATGKKGRDMWTRIRMSVGIRNLRISTGAYYVDKRRPPLGWDVEKHKNEPHSATRKRRNAISKKVLEYTIDRTLDRNTNPGVFIVIDENTSLSNVDKICMSKSDDKRTVRGNTYDSSDSKYKDLLQTHDYVANAAGSATKGFPLRALCLRMKIHRIRQHERI